MDEENEILIDEPQLENEPPKNNTSLNNKAVSENIGDIAKKIGTGINAQNSIVLITILCSFGVGVIFSILIIINVWKYPRYPDINLANEIKSIWQIVIPIITLSLGYAFGKSRD
ncbi:hypothetical protein [Pedobacter antarcticus]|uniref:hypothetical protein n=1 Tax=Pedobacter antarcticus TaxID=34086 RepID=UPI002931894F|nr:hypothetical protein [Pedobacter antarcticus]